MSASRHSARIVSALVPVVLLVAAVVVLLVRPRSAPVWLGPVAFSILGLSTSTIEWDSVRRALQLLEGPLLFLVFAVPLAVLLDELGVFEALAGLIDDGPHLVAGLWVLAAAVTIVFNLDASVVLLTPLYIRLARRHGLAPEMLAFQPALLACLASSPLPVSNLTNLIVAERFELGVGDFLRHLALPTLVACAVGWFGYRRVFDTERTTTDGGGGVDGDALRRGLPIIGFVLVGFTAGDMVGLPAWAVAAAAAAWASTLVRRVPWRAVPLEAMLVACGLAVLVVAAVPHLGLVSLLDAAGSEGKVRALALGVTGSSLANNLPAVLAASEALRSPSQVWPLLIGVNMGPVLVISGALSGLLWRDTASSLGVHVSPLRYSVVGLRVGLPALLSAAAVVVLL